MRAQQAAETQKALDMRNAPSVNAPITPAEVMDIAAQQRDLAAAKGKTFSPTDFGEKLRQALTMPPAQARKFLQK